MSNKWSSFENDGLIMEAWRRHINEAATTAVARRRRAAPIMQQPTVAPTAMTTRATQLPQRQTSQTPAKTQQTPAQTPASQPGIELSGPKLAAIDSTEYPDSLVNLLRPFTGAGKPLNPRQLLQILQFFKVRAKADNMDRLLEVDLSGASRNPRKFSQQTANEFSKLMAQLNVDVEPLVPVFHQWLRSNTLEMPTGATVTTPETGAPEPTALATRGAGTPTTTGGQEETGTAIRRLADQSGITLEPEIMEPLDLVRRLFEMVCEVIQMPPEEREVMWEKWEARLRAQPGSAVVVAAEILDRIRVQEKPCPTPDRQIPGRPAAGQIIDIDSDTGQPAIPGDDAPDQIGAEPPPRQLTDKGTDKPDVTPEPEPEPEPDTETEKRKVYYLDDSYLGQNTLKGSWDSVNKGKGGGISFKDDLAAFLNFFGPFMPKHVTEKGLTEAEDSAIEKIADSDYLRANVKKILPAFQQLQRSKPKEADKVKRMARILSAKGAGRKEFGNLMLKIRVREEEVKRDKSASGKAGQKALGRETGDEPVVESLLRESEIQRWKALAGIIKG